MIFKYLLIFYILYRVIDIKSKDDYIKIIGILLLYLCVREYFIRKYGKERKRKLIEGLDMDTISGKLDYFLGGSWDDLFALLISVMVFVQTIWTNIFSYTIKGDKKNKKDPE